MKIDKNELISQIREMKRNGFDYLVAITAVDYVKNIQALYFLRNISENKDEILEIELQPDNPSLPTIIHLFKGANWYERELSEMFGIKIEGRNAPKRKNINKARYVDAIISYMIYTLILFAIGIVYEKNVWCEYWSYLTKQRK